MSDDRSTDAADWHGLLEELRRWLPAIPEEHADWAAAQIIRLLYRRFGEQRMSEAVCERDIADRRRGRKLRQLEPQDLKGIKASFRACAEGKGKKS